MTDEPGRIGITPSPDYKPPMLAFDKSKPAETIERDERWEKVEAHVGWPHGYIYEEPDSPIDPTLFVQFFIEVRFGKSVYYSNIIVFKTDLEEARLRTYQFTLDKMVEQIDYYLDNSKED